MPDATASAVTPTAPHRQVADLLPAHVSGLVYEADGRRLIDHADLKLVSGSITVVMGPNGAGKSLLLRLLHGLIAPTSGDILWGGQPNGEKVRRRQAMVFQRPVMLHRSVAANIDFVLKLRGRASRERREEILSDVGLAAHARQSARLLSGGEQQRLALARALATEPAILFLDEPTANLDPAATGAIEDIVKRAHEGGAKIVYVTHDIGQARRLAGEVVFMHRGRILEQTPAAQFFSTPHSAEARNFIAGKLVL